jgi:anti-sigma B factor antagonist
MFASDTFAIERCLIGDAETLIVRGELDVFSTRRLRRELEDIIWRSGRGVVVDLCAADAIDTHGLSALVNAARRLEARGRRFAVLCGDGPVRRAFEVTGVHRQLRLVDAA